jgi:hypothetical protein
VEALAAHRLLARFGHDASLNIGVAKPSRDVAQRKVVVRKAWVAHFDAHAWVEYGGVVLVGGSDKQFIPLVRWSCAQ